MSSFTRVEVDAQALRRALRDIGDAGLKKELAAANRGASQVVVDRALPKVPVRSGRLKASVRALGGQTSATVKAGTAAVKYAAAIHWGRKKRGVIVGRPFLWDAAAEARNKVVDVYGDAIDDLLKKIR